VAGTAYASSDSIPDQVVTVNLKTGKTTPFIHGLQTAKGLVYLDASGNEPVLGTGPAATSTTGGDVSTPLHPTAATITKPGSDSDTLAIVLGAVAVVLAAGVGCVSLRRRRPGAG
jgi:hypothetical protein